MRMKNRRLWIAAFAALLAASACDSLPAQEAPPPRGPRARPNNAPPPPESVDKDSAEKQNKSAKTKPRMPASRGGLFPNLLGGGPPARLGNESRGEGTDREGAATERRGPRDSIDGRIPHNATESKHLEQAGQLMTSGQWDQALEILEIVLAHSDHATIR